MCSVTMATRLGRVMGENEQAPAVLAEVADHRVRAYSKLMSVYSAIQRAVGFLRGEREDAEDIVPNLRPGRPSASRKAEGTTEHVPAPVPAPVPGPVPAPATSGTVTQLFAPAADAFGPGGPFMPK